MVALLERLELEAWIYGSSAKTLGLSGERLLESRVPAGHRRPVERWQSNPDAAFSTVV